MFKNMPIFQYQYLVRTLNRPQPVRDHNACTPSQEFAHRLLDQMFSGRIKP